MLKEIPSSIERITTELMAGSRVYMLIRVHEETSIIDLNHAEGYVVAEDAKVTNEIKLEKETKNVEAEKIPEGGSEEPKKKRGRQKKEEQKKEPAHEKTKPFDIGKALALHMAGWSTEKIADEMGFTPEEVAERLHEAENE